MASKWSLILYSDEVSPGNQLKANNKRRLQTFYWTVKELGPKALSSEDAWMVLTTGSVSDRERAPGRSQPSDQGGHPELLCCWKRLRTRAFHALDSSRADDALLRLVYDRG